MSEENRSPATSWADQFPPTRITADKTRGRDREQPLERQESSILLETTNTAARPLLPANKQHFQSTNRSQSPSQSHPLYPLVQQRAATKSASSPRTAATPPFQLSSHLSGSLYPERPPALSIQDDTAGSRVHGAITEQTAPRSRQQHPPAIGEHQASPMAMNLVYQSDSHIGTTSVDRFRADSASYRYGSGSIPPQMQPTSQHGGQGPSIDDNEIHFWPVPRLVQGGAGPNFADTGVTNSHGGGGLQAYLPQGLQIPGSSATLTQPSASQGLTAGPGVMGAVSSSHEGPPSYIYDNTSPPLKRPVVYSQPPAYAGMAGTWSSSSTPTTEYPTAQYVLQSRRLNHEEELRQRGAHDPYPPRERLDDGGSGAAEFATMGGVHSGGFFDHPDAALWPLGPSQLAAVGRAPDYQGQMFSMMSSSPDHDRSRMKPGASLPLPKQFKCSACDAIFSRNHDLKRHARIHLAVKPFPCKFCDKAFSRKDALKRHVLVKGCGVGNKKNGEGRRRKAGKSAGAAGVASASNMPGQAEPVTSQSVQLLDAEDASPDSSFESQHHDYGQRGSDGGSVAMEATPSYEHGMPGGPSWKTLTPNAGGPGEGTLGGPSFMGGASSYGMVHARHPDFPGSASRPFEHTDPEGAARVDYRFEPLPSTGRAQVQSNSLANAYPSEMGDSSLASRRAFGMPGAASGPAGDDAGSNGEGGPTGAPRAGGEAFDMPSYAVQSRTKPDQPQPQTDSAYGFPYPPPPSNLAPGAVGPGAFGHGLAQYRPADPSGNDFRHYHQQ